MRSSPDEFALELDVNFDGFIGDIVADTNDVFRLYTEEDEAGVRLKYSVEHANGEDGIQGNLLIDGVA